MKAEDTDHRPNRLSSVTRGSPEAKEKEETEGRVVKAQSENTDTAAAQTEIKEDNCGATIAQIPIDAAKLPPSGAGSLSLSASLTSNENEPTKQSKSELRGSQEGGKAKRNIRREAESSVVAVAMGYNKQISSEEGRSSVAPSTRTSPDRGPSDITKAASRPASKPGALPALEGRGAAEAVVQHARELELHLRKAQVEVASDKRYTTGASRVARYLSSTSGAGQRVRLEDFSKEGRPLKDHEVYTPSSSGIPNRVTPPQPEGGNRIPTEAGAELLRKRLAEYMRAANHWSRVLGETTTILERCNIRNQEISQGKEEVVVRREEVEQSYVRLRNKEKQSKEDKDDGDVSEDQNSSEFVATSDSSSDGSFDGDADPMRALRAVCRGKPVYFRGQYFPGDDERSRK
ncbi:hypothetical protein BDY19DRAFT_611040 [Irpex rosettiformis]|uniref:Uncharacterized protein n=1 Tax=Irpex rosettiformis TaxID=378272 RepID=A0ACB8TPK5_9APHY|nr:hypothetical protein BDY19DRAFT_611040 [Irpex rosettiformis]